MPRLDPPPITRGEQGIPGKGFILSTTEPEVAQDGDIWVDPDTNPGNIYVPGDNEGVVSVDHLSDVNPHNITPALIGLGNVDNTSDVDKPVSVAVLAALNLKANSDHTHSILDLETTGTPSINNFLRGDGEWALGGTSDHTLLTNIGTRTHAQLEADIADRATIASLATKANVTHTHPIADLAVTGTPNAGVFLRGDGTWNAPFSPMTQAEAENAGSSAYRVVSGMRLAQAVAANNPKAHTHPISDITALQTALDAKANTSHTHSISDITALQTALDAKAALSHTHSIANVTSLQGALDGKAPISHTHSIANVTNLQGTLDGKAPISHTHDLSDLTATGDKDSTTFLRGDNTWAVPPAGGSGGGGATDHSQLTGIGVNTHAQIDSHIAATGNPHGVTATHLGLENVNNTSDASKPISTATQTALDGKANSSHTHPVTDMTATGTRSSTTYLRGDNTWATPTNTTYSVMTQVEAENAASTTARLTSGQRLSQAIAKHPPAPHTHPASALTATGTRDSTTFLRGDNTWAVPGGGGVTDHTLLTNIGTNTHTQIDTHIASTSNPHGVTAAQVGLGNVSNLAPMDMPVSIAVNAELNGKADIDHDHNDLYYDMATIDAYNMGADSQVPPSATNISINRQTIGGVKYPRLEAGGSGGYWGTADGAARYDHTHANAKGFVNHGSSASMARPSGYASVEWVGSVQPVNMVNGDTWVVVT